MLGRAVMTLALLGMASGAMAQGDPDQERGTLEHGWIEETQNERPGTLEHGWIEKTRNDPPGIHIFPTVNDPPGQHIKDGFGNRPRLRDYPPGPRW